MSFPTLALIGTAGRGTDRDQLSPLHHHRMINGVTSFIQQLAIPLDTVNLVSGGAAWCDHLAVSMVIGGYIRPDQLKLYLPCTLTESGYEGDNEWMSKVANTANYYHKLFREKTGVPSILELNSVIRSGCSYEVSKGGFKARNSQVANFVSETGVLLAFTFGKDEYGQVPWSARRFSPETTGETGGLKDGGTADTFTKAKCVKYHCKIGPITNPEDYF